MVHIFSVLLEDRVRQCLKCTGKSVKNGFQSGKPRYKRKACGHQFVVERGKKNQWMKDFAIQRYQRRVTIPGIAKLLQARPPTVLDWIRQHEPQYIEKPQPAQVKGIQLDDA